MAPRKLQIMYVTRIIFKLGHTDQKHFWLSSKALPYMNFPHWLPLSSSKPDLLAADRF